MELCVSDLDRSTVYNGTATIRNTSQKLFQEPEAQALLRDNLQALLRAAIRSPEEISELSKCSPVAISRAGSGLSVEYSDAVRLATYFKKRLLTLLTEDVTKRNRV